MSPFPSLRMLSSSSESAYMDEYLCALGREHITSAGIRDVVFLSEIPVCNHPKAAWVQH